MAAQGSQKSKPAPAAPKPASLQRLGWVQDVTAAGAEYASGLYGAVKSRLPAVVKAQAEKFEGIANQVAKPAYEKLLAVAQEALKYADAKADAIIHTGSEVTSRAIGALHPDRLAATAAHARDVLVIRIQSVVSAIQEQGITGAIRRTSAEVVAIPRRVYSALLDETSPAVNYSRATVKRAVDLTHDSATGVYHYAVNKSQKVVDVAQAKGQQAHDILVKQPLYKDAYERTNTLLGAAQESGVYKATVARIYPIVKPVYEPTFEKIEPYYKSTLNYWKPISAAA